MAASGDSSFKSKTKYQGISTALASAVLEWLLICMLFIDAIFSYLITKFARVSKLQVPCLLCSRLDHILGNKKLKYYWDLICKNHKFEISNLVLCHAHNNLVDVHGMCESCLFSFATINKSNAETYRLLVGKLGEDSSFHLYQHSSIEGQRTKNCSCCNKPWIPRDSGQKLMQAISISSEASDLDVHSSGSRGHDQEIPRKIKRFVSFRATNQRNGSVDPLSHVVYSELKIDSDAESEGLFSDDDRVHAVIHEISPKEYATVGCAQPEPPIITLQDNPASEKLVDPTSASEANLVSLTQLDVLESHSSIDIASKVEIGYGLEEINWQQADIRVDPSIFPKLISIDEVPPSSIDKELSINVSEEIKLISVDDVAQSSGAGETIAEASEDNKPISIDDIPQLTNARETLVQASKDNELIFLDGIPPKTDSRETPIEISKESSEVISLVDVLPSSNMEGTPFQGSKESNVVRSEEVWQTSETDCEQICKEASAAATTDTAPQTTPVSCVNGSQAPNLLDLGDAYKLAVGNRGRQLSGVLAEQWIGKDSSRVSEDLKFLLSQLSAVREQSLNDVSPRVAVSPRVSLNSDELKTSDASNAIGMQILQKRISLERNESGLSLDGSLVSEIDGESVVDRLNRQIEHDKKLVSALYKELEEERNASTIAANQAMAMITKVQEEKATLHMEALQCLRMMEEQAEYDVEALQKANDLLTEREKEIQDLEAELEFYRDRFPNESILEDTIESVSDVKAAGFRVDHSDAQSDTFPKVEDKSTSTVKNSLFEFEDERSYILRSLTKLEKKLYLFSNNGVCMDVASSEYPGNEEGINGLSVQNNLGNDKENFGICHSEQSTHIPPGAIDLDTLVNEVSDLNKRLEALEADRNFLEHSMNSIRNGEEGVRFIEDIASQLKELRKIGTQTRDQNIA